MILLTGATGFVGRALCARLAADNPGRVRAAVRRSTTALPEGVAQVVVGDLAPSTDWGAALQGATTVLHLAARVHVMRDTAADPLAQFRRVNVDATAALARAAHAAGARRLVYVSSIKVNGEQTPPGRPFTASDAPAPSDPYGISKHEAEVALRQIASASGLEVTIVRPVLVYGPGVKGNFLTLMRWLRRGIPLPLGAIHNQRSLVALDNLVDLLVRCVEHPAAANQIFLVSDGEDLSTTELLRRAAAAMGVSPRLVPVPEQILLLGAALLGKRAVAQRLLGSLQVDIAATCSRLEWRPPVAVDEGLRRAAWSA